eukprot:TRINITY_DN2110_c0_g1_i2.p1 TRINITY_DN2110_c0_g1~~TRINITY_DN2110_c0_g1_i2.p1  ORF type:complete len:519 (-),score=142.54 TRINITY_DN2110_c0_g1_i2:65-1621(-)
MRLNPKAEIAAHHGNIKAQEYGPKFFSQFALVFNALDNLDARRYVNRICVSLKIPFIESATEGYLGQLTAIFPGDTECFECNPREPPKTFAVCTIRTNPSEPIHCIHWAKMLFARIYGIQEDANAVTNLDTILSAVDEKSDLSTVAGSVFDQVFNKDIEVLAKMDKLWANRRAPVPLCYADAERDHATASVNADAARPTSGDAALPDQQLWNVATCAQKFVSSIAELFTLARSQAQGKGKAVLTWDKDCAPALDFVTAAANLRAHIFGIPMQSRFNVKAQAGNIIPALATTNAIIAGMAVMEGIKVLTNQRDRCRTAFLRGAAAAADRRLLVPCHLSPPSASCFVCGHRCMTLRIDTARATLGALVEGGLKKALSFTEPQVVKGGTILYECGEGLEDDEVAYFAKRTALKLTDVGITDTVLLSIFDEAANFTLDIRVSHAEFADNDDGARFEVVDAAREVAAAQEDRRRRAENDEQHRRAVERDEADADAVVLVEAKPATSGKRKHEEISGGADAIVL